MPWNGTVVYNVESTYNSSDIVRENQNIEYLYNLLTSLGYEITLTYAINEGYTRLSFPTVTDINQVRQNINDMINGFPTALDKVEKVGPAIGTFYSNELSMIYYSPVVPVIKVMPDRKQKFDYIEANKLELSLKLLYDLSLDEASEFKVCGAFYSGEEGLVY